MSHLTTFKTALNDPKKVERALVFLGFQYKKDAKINSINAVPISEFVITNAGHWNVGLQRGQDGTYDVIGDSVSWDGMQRTERLKTAFKGHYGDTRREVFAGILAQACAITTAIIEAQHLGHQITFADPDEKGVIRARVVSAS